MESHKITRNYDSENEIGRNQYVIVFIDYTLVVSNKNKLSLPIEALLHPHPT